MKQYLVVKKVNLQVGEKTYRKGAIITAELVTQRNIDRYLNRGYIVPVGEDEPAPVVEDENAPTTNFPVPPEYLSVDEVEALEKPQLLEYAKIVGVKGFRSNIAVAQLATLVNTAIDKIMDDDNEDDSDENNEEENNAEGNTENNNDGAE